MSLAQALSVALAYGLDRLDAQRLLLHLLGRAPTDRAWLLAHDNEALNPSSLDQWNTLLRRRAAGEPMAYLTGHQAFYGLDLMIDPRVLVPRPDTETLVDWALDLLTHPTADLDPIKKTSPSISVIDLGTGSGAIALALKHCRPNVHVSAIDASPQALALASLNAKRLGLEIHFQTGSWLTDVSNHYFLIVSNPPYIAENDPHLRALQHEPALALSSGVDGLNDIRTIIEQAPARLLPAGWLLLEHGFDQAPSVRAMLAQRGFTQVQSHKDLAGIERCSGGQWREVK
ncbi:MAG: peptide chain release factor N(5)-glutamine methyltransferase [Burkholderiaceae bacterium]